ncbi:MAG: outer membrane protein assembly factor BamA [Deltaproteobacteria bacterium]|nr:outer membrane protein assembly factor BamA [Deltaproteobacteria bacterium]
MKQFSLKTVLVIFLCGLPFLADAFSFVHTVKFAGLKKTEESAVRTTIETKDGMTYSEERIRRDIEALFKLGLFRQIKVEKTVTGKGIELTYHFEEKETINRIVFKGNKKVKEEKLRGDLQVKPFEILNPAKVTESIQKMLKRYADEGYHLVEITTELKKIEEGGQELIFQIREGDGIRIKRINFIGNKNFRDKELKKVLQSKEKGYFSWLSSSGKYHEEALDHDVGLLAYHYLNNGYLKVKVERPRVYLSKDRRWLFMTFHVTEGEKYKIKSIDMEGDILTTKQELIAKMVTKPGQLYSRKNLEKDMQMFSTLYGDHGYAFANFNPVTIPDDATRTADLIYKIEKGSRIRIERINISGNTITRDKVIRRELKITENSLYSETALKQSRERLEALGYFEEVNFATPRGSADDKIVLNITVKEKPTGTFSIGAGFSSVENFIFNSSITKSNFFGYGISGQFSTELSSLRQLFVLSFEDPYLFDTKWILGLSGFKTVNRYTDFDRSSFGGTFSLGHRVFEHSSLRLMYQLEQIEVNSFSTVVPAIFSKTLDGLTSSLTAIGQRDTRNNRLFPSKGLFDQISSEVAGTGMGGDNDFYRLTLNHRHYQPLFWKTVFKGNLLMGYIRSLNDQPVPLFERYFLGGVNSLRGFFPRSVGPKVQVPLYAQGSDTEFVIGGNKLLQANLEVEAPIYDPAGFKFVTFYDLGNTYSEEQQISLKNLRSDYGFGLRWNSPFGPMRFEWGIPIDQRPGEDDVVFNFTIGSFF